jgi:hypothetical protein
MISTKEDIGDDPTLGQSRYHREWTAVNGFADTPDGPHIHGKAMAKIGENFWSNVPKATRGNVKLFVR